MESPIPFNQPTLVGNELKYIEESLRGGHVSSSGPFSDKAAEKIREFQGAAKVFLTTSCTDALEMGGMLLGLRPGDVAIVPSFTFVSTALALVRRGVKLLFADIERETLGIDPRHVASLLDDRVKVVVPVHYAGIACDMESLTGLVAGRPIDLFEDNAQGLYATYQGRPLGSFGRISTLSFHETKNFICGEGGALVLNRAEDIQLANILYDKGTNRQDFLRNQVDKYSWVGEGSSFGMSDVLAAYLLAQLEERGKVTARRKSIWEGYARLLSPFAGKLPFTLPPVPAGRSHSYHAFHLLLDDQKSRDRVLTELALRGIHGAFHFMPLHQSEGAKPHLARATECPVSVEISRRILRLPFHNALTDEQVERTAATFLEILKNP